MFSLPSLVLLSVWSFGLNTPETLFATHLSDELVSIDPETGEILDSIPLSGIIDIYGMTFDGVHLLAIERGPFFDPDKLLSLHPADGTKKLLGFTGELWNIAALEFDPTSGVLYGAHINDLYEMDQVSGKANWLGSIQGLKPLDCICGLAIDSQGKAFAIGNLGHALYSLDIPTMTASHLGDLPFASGVVTDAAINSQGRMFATWSPFDFSPIGVYEVDMANLTVTHFANIGISAGIAFAPAVVESAYCTAKLNSVGCSPILETNGYASPTASSGYAVAVTNVLNDTNGRLLYTVAGSASNPFGGGTLCINSPWKGTTIVKSGGSAKPILDCTGVWTADLNTELAAKPGPQAGDTIYCQWMGRDPGFPAPNNYSLSSAVGFTLLP